MDEIDGDRVRGAVSHMRDEKLFLWGTAFGGNAYRVDRYVIAHRAVHLRYVCFTQLILYLNKKIF